ncbi:NAD-dependent epimerase/dehydratase family protein [Occultella kanbiaonis]|uniref:NAD-dependent epimerase/dehydratase family protein n=1 Tax=Occultella kanbiaonis TaxID=2675754 RepID=UPI001E34BEC8|nr:NAD-dependent epimerase/dehydratase family protein [Occultella kanbiaonis]
MLVTGASGLLGGTVARLLVETGYMVTTFQRRPSGVDGARDLAGSLDDLAAIASAVGGQDAVVHLAAKVSVSGGRADYERINVRGTAGLLDAAREAGVSRFVQVSSPSVAHTGASLVGAGAGPAQPERARGHYARTKAAAEVAALAADAPGFAVTAVRPHLVWGPGDTQLVARIIERARAGRLPLLDHGAALVDTIYVDNAAEAIIAALEHTDRGHGQAFVVTNGEPRPIGDLIAGMCLAAGVEPPTWRVPAGLARVAGAAVEAVWAIRPGADEPPMTRFLAEQLSTAHWFDQRHTRDVLDWAPRVSIDEGLTRLAKYYSA